MVFVYILIYTKDSDNLDMKIIYVTLKMSIMIGAGHIFYIFQDLQKKDNLIFHVNLLTLKLKFYRLLIMLKKQQNLNMSIGESFRQKTVRFKKLIWQTLYR